MVRVALRIFGSVALALAASTAGCVKSETTSDSSSAQASESAEDVKLRTFDYDIDKLMLTSLGRRIGCDRASQFVRYPREGTLATSIERVMTSTAAYRTFKSELADRASITASCATGATAALETDKNAGIKHLLEAARKTSPCAAAGCPVGLTFVMIGGLGGSFDKEGPWLESRDAWKQLAQSRGVPGRRRGDGSIDSALRVWRLDADRSYRPDDETRDNLIAKLNELEASEPSNFAHQYFFVGYSKGGVTAIDMLGTAPEIRERTLGVMTLAAPMAGTVVFDMVSESLRGPILAHAKLSGAIEDATLRALEGSPLAYLLAGATSKEDFKRIAENAADFTRGLASLSSATRKKYLYDWLPLHDFKRASGRAVPIMQVAGLVDLVDLTPLPQVTYQGGKITMKQTPNTLDDFKQTVFAPTFKNYPLNDTIVSLEQAAIPKRAFVKGLAPSLHALLSLDHLRVRMRAKPGDPAPYIEIVDALMDSAAARIEAMPEGGSR